MVLSKLAFSFKPYAYIFSSNTLNSSPLRRLRLTAKEPCPKVLSVCEDKF